MGLQDHETFRSVTVAERLLVDVARLIQLSPTDHVIANEHYTALCAYVDRKGSPLEGMVVNCYPSGSFAIGAVIASSVRKKTHDLDVVIELNLPATTPPVVALVYLFNAINGEEGSRYFGKVTRNSRCVTVEYNDGFKVDLMPLVRDGSFFERRGFLFHYKSGESYHKPINPYGFKTEYNSQVKEDPSFVRAFRDGFVELAKAQTEPMDKPARLEEKSPRTVALQLLKRFRDLRFRRPARKGWRCPPSVVLAALALEKAQVESSVLWELIGLTRHIRDRLRLQTAMGLKIDVRNPSWQEDIFTDRWPETVIDQQTFQDDLNELDQKLTALARETYSPTVARDVLEELFGATAAIFAVDGMSARTARDADLGRQKFSPSGTLLTGAAASASTRAASRPSTDFGEAAD